MPLGPVGLGGDEPQGRGGRYGDAADRAAVHQAADPRADLLRHVSFQAGQVEQAGLEEGAGDVGGPLPHGLGADGGGDAVVDGEVGDAARPGPEAVLRRHFGACRTGPGLGRRQGGSRAVRPPGRAGARVAGDRVDRALAGGGGPGGGGPGLRGVGVDVFEAGARARPAPAQTAQCGRLEHRFGGQADLDQAGPAVGDVEEVEARLSAGAPPGQAAQGCGLGDPGDLGGHARQVGGVTGPGDAGRLVLHQGGQFVAHPVAALAAVGRVVELRDRHDGRLAQLAGPGVPVGQRYVERVQGRRGDARHALEPGRELGHGLGGGQVRDGARQIDGDRDRGVGAEADGVPGDVAHAPADGQQQRQVVADPEGVAAELRRVGDLRAGADGGGGVGAAGLGVAAARVGLVDQQVGRGRGRLQPRELEVALVGDADAALPP